MEIKSPYQTSIIFSFFRNKLSSNFQKNCARNVQDWKNKKESQKLNSVTLSLLGVFIVGPPGLEPGTP